MATVVGSINNHIQQLLGISVSEDANIYLGPTNITHMQTKHPQDYQKYGQYLPSILHTPDYIGINPSDGSIEFVKEFNINNEYVKVAVRISSGQKYYARSLYILNSNRVQNFIQKGTLKPV